MSIKKVKPFIESLMGIAKKHEGPSNYSRYIMVKDGQAVFTNGLILIKGPCNQLLSNGLYDGKTFMPVAASSDSYPKTEGFFKTNTGDTAEILPRVVEVAKLIKPESLRALTAISSQGQLILKGQSYKDAVRLEYANIAVSLGLDICMLNNGGIYEFTNENRTIILITPSMRDGYND